MDSLLQVGGKHVDPISPDADPEMAEIVLEDRGNVGAGVLPSRDDPGLEAAEGAVQHGQPLLTTNPKTAIAPLVQDAEPTQFRVGRNALHRAPSRIEAHEPASPGGEPES